MEKFLASTGVIASPLSVLKRAPAAAVLRQLLRLLWTRTPRPSWRVRRVRRVESSRVRPVSGASGLKLAIDFIGVFTLFFRTRLAP